MFHRSTSAALTLVVALGLVVSASCGDRQHGGKLVMRARTDDAGGAARKCTKEERAELGIQVEVIRNYWALPYEEEYNTFSSGFKHVLKDAGASSASEYADIMASNQRQWIRQTYEEAELRDAGHGRVTVLAEWKEGDYRGVQSVVFDMVKEDGMWKIESIFY
jgi:hypothetical protein